MLRIALLTLACLLPGVAAAETAKSPSAAVARLQAAILDAAKLPPAASFEQRREQLAPVIASSHDIPHISRLITGRYWRQFSTDQQQRFVDAFERLTVATYAARFKRYSGEQFSLIDTQEQPRGAWQVRSELHTKDAESITLSYLLHRKGDDWRIINVVADGVSDLALRRSEYSRILKEKGYDALLSELEQQIAQLMEDTV